MARSTMARWSLVGFVLALALSSTAFAAPGGVPLRSFGDDPHSHGFGLIYSGSFGTGSDAVIPVSVTPGYIYEIIVDAPSTGHPTAAGFIYRVTRDGCPGGDPYF